MLIKRNNIYCCDVRDGLKAMIEQGILVDCVIDSPPYWSLRDYGIPPSVWDGDPNCEHQWDFKIQKFSVNLNDKKNSYDRSSLAEGIKSGFCLKCGAWKGTLGLEPNFELYIKHLCDIYDLVWQVLKPTGTNWVNMGDTYAGSGGAGGDYNKGGLREGQLKYKQNKPRNTPSTCLTMIPERFAIEMINRGWILRNIPIWHKPNCMPSSAKNRFTVDYEFIYFFVKSNKTQYWVNENTTQLVSKQPKGTRGIENIDWEWRECNKCLGTGVKHDECKYCKGNGFYYNEVLRPVKCKECSGLGRIRRTEVCKRCKGEKVIRYNFWRGRTYYFEQQREGLSSNPATRERYKYKVGDQSHRKDTNQKLVKPGKPFNLYFPEDIPQEKDYPILKYTENEIKEITKKTPSGVIYSRGSNKGGVQAINNPHAHWGYTRGELELIRRETASKKRYKRGISDHHKNINGAPGQTKHSICQPRKHDKNREYPYQGRAKRCVWTIPTKPNPEAHFATFPPDLVKPMILSGCPEFVCSKCGKPRERIIELGKVVSTGGSNKGIRAKNKNHFIESGHDCRAMKQHEHIIKGYTDCGCGAPFKPGIVVDPFTGTGTTLKTAWNLGRDFIGMDISEEYVNTIAKKTLRSTKNRRLTEFV